MHTIRTLLSRFSSVFGLISLLLLATAPRVSAAAAPQLYFSAPPTASVAANSTTSLELRLKPNGVAVNTVDVSLSFPADKLRFTGLDKAGSYFDTFLPATPSATDGKLHFSAGSLASGSTTDDVLVASLSFSATASSGSADISLDGSQVADNGTAMAVTTSDSQLSFTPATGSGNTSVGITAVTATDPSLNGGVIQWKTAVPATSSVDYGNTTNYGFTAGSSDLTTDHRVDLGSKFAGHTTVHFRVTSVDATGQRQSSADQTFTTLGYTVRIHVVNKQQQAQVGVPVSIAGSTAVKTDSGGNATITNVGAGNQQVQVDGKIQSINVKAVKAAAARSPQQFIVVADSSQPLTWYLGSAALLLVVVIVCLLIYHHWRGRQAVKQATS